MSEKFLLLKKHEKEKCVYSFFFIRFHFIYSVTTLFRKHSHVKKREGDKIIEASSPIEDFPGMEISGVWTYNGDNLVQKYVAKGVESEAEYEYSYNEDCELIQTLERSSAEGQNY